MCGLKVAAPVSTVAPDLSPPQVSHLLLDHNSIRAETIGVLPLDNSVQVEFLEFHDDFAPRNDCTLL